MTTAPYMVLRTTCTPTSSTTAISLPTRRLYYLKLCYLYQLINGNFIFLNAPLVSQSLLTGLRNASLKDLHTNVVIFFQIPSQNGMPYIPVDIQSKTYLPSFYVILVLVILVLYRFYLLFIMVKKEKAIAASTSCWLQHLSQYHFITALAMYKHQTFAHTLTFCT